MSCEGEEIIQAVVALLIVGNWLRKVVGRARQEEPPPAPAPEPEPEATREPAPVVAPTMFEEPTGVEDDVLADLARRTAAERRRAELLLARHGQDVAFEPFREALRDHLLPELDDVQEAIEDAGARLAAVGGAAVLDPGSVRDIEALLRRSRLRLDQLQQWWAQRADPQARHVLGDADALARALYRPLIEVATRTRVPVRPAVPVCAFSEHGPAMSLIFHGTGVAPVLLPERFAREVTAWPVIAHEVGHAVHDSFPGLVAEVAGLLEPMLPVERWAPELFADAMGVLLLGPAFVLAQERELADPDEPLNVVVAPATEEAGLLEHPPAHLRMRFVTAVLDRMGFPTEAADAWERWDEAHDSPEAFYFPSRHGGYVGIEAESLLEAAADGARTLVSTALRSMGGHALSSFPGLAFGAPQQQATVDLMRDLASGAPRRADPRAIVAAAVLVGRDGEVSTRRLADLVRRSILGIGTGEAPGRPGGPAAAAAPVAPASRHQELVEALVLAEAVVTPARASRWS